MRISAIALTGALQRGLTLRTFPAGKEAAMRTALWVLSAGLSLSALACHDETRGTPDDRSGRNKAGAARDDRGGMALAVEGQIAAANPGVGRPEVKVNTGTRDQRTSGVSAIPSGSLGATPGGSATNTLGSDRDVNERGALAAPPAGSARPSTSNVPNQAAPSSEPAATSPKEGRGGTPR